MTGIYSRKGLKFNDLIKHAEKLEAEAEQAFNRGKFHRADKLKLEGQRFRNLATVFAEDKESA